MPSRGLYAITDSCLPGDHSLTDAVDLALRGGARIIQYREKQLPPDQRTEMARTLAQLCQHRQVPLIINDDVELAANCGAAGVHLGAEDASVTAARARLGRAAIIGSSCYNSLARAQAAVAAGADYVAFGRFFPSRSKPDAVTAEPGLLTTARAQLDVPIVAIGGITPDNGGQLLAAGADLLAVIHGLFGQADIEAAAARYTALFEQ